MGTAKYSKIIEELRREILSGKYEAGSGFPSGAELAGHFGVSRPTINRVMYELRREGLVTTRPGGAPRLTRFAQHATGALGIIHPGVRYGDVLSNICEELVKIGDRHGWDIVTIELATETPEARLEEMIEAIRRFADERVAGLLFQPFEHLKAEKSGVRRFWSELARCNMPVVFLDHNPQMGYGSVGYDLVSMDNVRAGAGLGRELLARGHGKLAYLLKPGSPPSCIDRMRGVASAAIEAGLAWSRGANVLECEPDNIRAVRNFLRSENPDAIVCSNDAMAMELYRTMSRIKGAGAVKIAGFDNHPEAAKLGITSVVQPCAEIAEIAFQTLLARMRNPALPPRTITVADRGIVG